MLHKAPTYAGSCNPIWICYVRLVLPPAVFMLFSVVVPYQLLVFILLSEFQPPSILLPSKNTLQSSFMPLLHNCLCVIFCDFTGLIPAGIQQRRKEGDVTSKKASCLSIAAGPGEAHCWRKLRHCDSWGRVQFAGRVKPHTVPACCWLLMLSRQKVQRGTPSRRSVKSKDRRAESGSSPLISTLRTLRDFQKGGVSWFALQKKKK